MKTTNTYQRMRTLAAMGFVACATLALMPLGCGGIKTVPFRQHPTAEHPAMPRITAERLSGCVKDYAELLEQRPYGVQAKVQVDDDGRIVNVVVDGPPDSAPDFAACVRVTLHDMAVPEWMLQLRPDKPIASTNEKTTPAGNAIANPIVVVEVLVALAELAVEWGGVEVVFTVNLETVGWTVAAAQVAEAATRRRSPKDKCTDYYEACVASKLYWEEGNHWKDTRCDLCRLWCYNRNNGKWPSQVPFGDSYATCNY